MNKRKPIKQAQQSIPPINQCIQVLENDFKMFVQSISEGYYSGAIDVNAVSAILMLCHKIEADLLNVYSVECVELKQVYVCLEKAYTACLNSVSQDFTPEQSLYCLDECWQSVKDASIYADQACNVLKSDLQNGIFTQTQNPATIAG